jgi:hypothetical protein
MRAYVGTTICGRSVNLLIRNLLGSLVEDVADVRGLEVAGDDVGLALSMVEEPAGFHGEFVLVPGPVGVRVRFEVPP